MSIACADCAGILQIFLVFCWCRCCCCAAVASTGASIFYMAYERILMYLWKSRVARNRAAPANRRSITCSEFDGANLCTKPMNVNRRRTAVKCTRPKQSSPGSFCCCRIMSVLSVHWLPANASDACEGCAWAWACYVTAGRHIAMHSRHRVIKNHCGIYICAIFLGCLLACLLPVQYTLLGIAPRNRSKWKHAKPALHDVDAKLLHSRQRNVHVLFVCTHARMPFACLS